MRRFKKGGGEGGQGGSMKSNLPPVRFNIKRSARKMS